VRGLLETTTSEYGYAFLMISGGDDSESGHVARHSMPKKFNFRFLVYCFLFQSSWTQRASNQLNHRDGGLVEGGYKCKTCKRVVMSLQTFLRNEKSHSNHLHGVGVFEESLQSEFEKLCTYSNVFFDKTFRKSVRQVLFV
jgi:hypothetical protein